jgi:phosphatidylglycerol:prolipoprotein diacylglycerol transferase
VIPFLHLGPITIPTFGLMVACAMLAAFFVLRADLERRGLAASSGKRRASEAADVGAQAKAGRVDAEKTSGTNATLRECSSVLEKSANAPRKSANAEAEMLIAIPSLVGLAGAKLYHLLESPAEFFAHPVALLISPYGFAWFGGLLAGFAAFVWVGRRQRVPLLTLLDVGSPAAALGYGIGRIGCFLSGDGDYGIPTSLPWGMSFPNGLVPTTERVHPTPIYELIAACVIAWFLWRMGTRQIAAARRKAYAQVRERDTTPEDIAALKMNPGRGRKLSRFESFLIARRVRLRLAWRRPQVGAIFSMYLVLTGLARFLVEFIRINPRSFLGMSNAQTASFASTIVGIVLWFWLAKNSNRTP